jgi:hypothetical protein
VIKALLSNGAIVLGLSEMNVRELKKGRPIRFDGRPMGFQGTVFICYGETEVAILHELQQAEGRAETKQ